MTAHIDRIGLSTLNYHGRVSLSTGESMSLIYSLNQITTTNGRDSDNGYDDNRIHEKSDEDRDRHEGNPDNDSGSILEGHSDDQDGSEVSDE